MGEFTKPLILHTPHEVSDRAKDAQWLMQGNNPFAGLAPYKDGPLDGEYGPVTASATKRAKYWLGYATPDAVFGQFIYEYLTGKRALPPDYVTRRKQRIKAAENTPGMRALNLAAGEVGYVETPRNLTKYGADYGFNGVPWCAIFETWCFKHSGWFKFKYAAVELIYYDARAGRNGMRIVQTPAHGDVVLYSMHGSRFARTAFYDEKLTDTTFRDLGGNTGQASFNNGGQVARGERNVSQVLAYVRVG